MLKRLLILLFPVCVLAQQKNIPLSKDAEHFIMKIDADNDSIPIFTNFKPLKENASSFFLSERSFKNPTIGLQCIGGHRPENFDSSPKWLNRKLKHESLIIINDTATKFHFTIDPLFNFQIGKNKEDKTGEKLYTNTRGFIARGDIGSDFSFETSFSENQSTFPSYLDAFASNYSVIPGQGRWKGFKTNAYDYAMASGYISYSPNKHFNFQLGHGKHFVGDGYRSLLLSDFAFNYPYLRITANYGKIQYTQLYAILMNLNSGATPFGTEKLYQKKAASFQMLSWNVHKRIQLGLFQGLIWEAADSKNNQHLNLNYFNPVIFSNACIYGLNNTNNVVLGGTIKIRPLKTISIYGQYALDDGFADIARLTINNKHAFQFGVRGIDLFTVRNLNFLIEYNRARPYTYSHGNADQSYTHYNQSLAHPLGANFSELVATLGYRWKDFFIDAKIVMASIGADSSNTNFGSNVFNPTYIYQIGSTATYEQNQGVKSTLNYIDLKAGYIINPVTNMNISAGIILRDYQYASISSKTNWFYVAFRTSLSNIYYDF